MREFKFRAWDTKGKGFINGFNMIGFSDGQGSPNKKLQRFSTEWAENDYILQQYTGLKDKNGKEIYEGDIVHMLEVGNDFQREYVTDIKWEDCCFLMKSEKMDHYDTYLGAWGGNPEITYPLFEITVIGNIFKNPELLEVQQNENT